ncbi:MAG: glycogen/starch synthase, partial [Chloroflexi bacterium]|nr:glycogen/starch synthase [Chloroflexota bacterium]
MRVLMLSWEFPPHIVGGLGAHVGALAPALARLGIEVHVVTPRKTDSPTRETVGGVQVHRVPSLSSDQGGSFFEQTVRTNRELTAACVRLREEVGGFDLVHNHDWLTAFAAREVKHAFHLP